MTKLLYKTIIKIIKLMCSNDDCLIIASIYSFEQSLYVISGSFIFSNHFPTHSLIIYKWSHQPNKAKRPKTKKMPKINAKKKQKAADVPSHPSLQNKNFLPSASSLSYTWATSPPVGRKTISGNSSKSSARF